MLSAVLGLFSQDLAVDLGTARTRVHQRGAGLVSDEPTLLVIRTDPRGRRTVIAVGDDAHPMLGRTPQGHQVIEPIAASRVSDFEAAEALLLHLIRRSHGRNRWIRPRMLIAAPHGASPMEVRAIRDSCESAGAREVHLIPRPLAAALGAELPVECAAGHLVVDVGAGSTEVSLVALHGVVSGTTVPGGGRGIDERLIRWLGREHALLVGQPTAERLKETLGTADPDTKVRTATATGRCLRDGIPRAVEVSSRDLQLVLVPALEEIASAIRTTLESAPPELATDIVDHGVVLTGGGARLRRMDRWLSRATGLAVVTAEDPSRAVSRGIGSILEQPGLLSKVAQA